MATKPIEIAMYIFAILAFIGSAVYIRATASQSDALPEAKTEHSFMSHEEHEHSTDMKIEIEPEFGAVPKKIKQYVIYDIPLPTELQEYIQDCCEEYSVDYKLALALMWRESNFNTMAVSQSGCYGLMQLNELYYPEAKNLDVRYIVRTGISLLGNYIMQYGDIEMALIAYNCGSVGARKLFLKNIYSTKYSRAVIGYTDSLVVRERVYIEG